MGDLHMVNTSRSNGASADSERSVDAFRFSHHDTYLFKEGSHFQLYNKLGAHPAIDQGREGVFFAVWAPNAHYLSVVGEFNGWRREAHPLCLRQDDSGVWEGFIPDVKPGCLYKYFIHSKHHDYQVEKIDLFAYHAEAAPQTASIVWDLDYEWNDRRWMAERKHANALQAPMSIYEMHLGSWRRDPKDPGRYLNCRELAEPLTAYILEMGFTHVEFMPIMEHPYYPSWGYQTLGYFAATHRYGTPQDLMYLIDVLHQNNIGVILDWVPSHFPTDGHGLSYYDGTHLYEHSDPQKGFHPDWQCNIFNNGRNEVKEFLISSALFWLDKYHADGLRVDAVASMLYLDYSREHGEWAPNIHGGRENLESIAFLQKLNEVVYTSYPDVQMFAEESTSWPNVSRPVHDGGLGFGMKWNMGWMHDTLKYFSKDPLYRKYHHSELTFSMLYAFTENFVLALSHDEVVHGKRSILNRMPGDPWQQFANLRLLYAYMYGHPGKKLLFMGDEFGQWNEWYHEKSLDWHLTDQPLHQGVQLLLRDLNRIYRREKAMHASDFDGQYFEWIDGCDHESGVVSFIRRDPHSTDEILVVSHFTPTPRMNYRIGVPSAGRWDEILNSDAVVYGGSGMGNMGSVDTDPVPIHNRAQSLNLSLPPLGVLFFKKNQSE